MADWKLEKVESHVDPGIEGDDIDAGLVWLLTLGNERDIFVFANAPNLFDAARALMAAADKHDNAGIKKAISLLTVAVLLASGDQPTKEDSEVVH